MTVAVALNATSVTYGIDAFYSDIVGTLFVRVVKKDSAGNWIPADDQAKIEPFISGNSDVSQILEALRFTNLVGPSSGDAGIDRTTFDNYMKSKTKVQVLADIKQWIVQCLIPAILFVLNKYVKNETPSGGAGDGSGHFTQPIEVLLGAIGSITFAYDPTTKQYKAIA